MIDNLPAHKAAGRPSRRAAQSFATCPNIRPTLIAVAHASLGGVGGDHAMAGVVEQKVP